MAYNMKRATANSLTNQLVSRINKMGESKAENKANSEKIGANGHSKSDSIHSAKSLDNFRSVTNQLLDNIKENGGNFRDNINQESGLSLLREKLDNGEISGASANTYISTFGNIGIAVEKMGYDNPFPNETLKDMRENLKQDYDLSKEHKDRSYNDPHEIVENMKNGSEWGLSAELQLEVGLRVDDSINSEKWNLNEDKTLHIEGSKNGVNYTTKELSKELADKVERAIEEGYKTTYQEYREDLKEAVEQQGEGWNGTHGLRYNFAQGELNEKLENGSNYTEALKEVSEIMGHSRADITEHYTKF